MASRWASVSPSFDSFRCPDRWILEPSTSAYCRWKFDLRYNSMDPRCVVLGAWLGCVSLWFILPGLYPHFLTLTRVSFNSSKFHSEIEVNSGSSLSFKCFFHLSCLGLSFLWLILISVTILLFSDHICCIHLLVCEATSISFFFSWQCNLHSCS